MKVDILFKGLTIGPDSEEVASHAQNGQFEMRRHIVQPVDGEDNPHPPVNPLYHRTVTCLDVAQTHARFPLPKSPHFGGFDAAPPARVERTGRILWSYVVAKTDDDASLIARVIELLAPRP